MAKKLWIGGDSGGENDWSVADNWSPSGVPDDGDDVYIQNSSIDITAGLNQSAKTLASLNIASTFTGSIGTASAYLQIGVTLLRIGDPGGDSQPGSGSGRIKIDLGSVASTIVVLSSSSSSSDTGLEPIRIKGTSGSNTLSVIGGRVGVATTVPGETATLSRVDVGEQATVNLGEGCTLTTVNQSGGTLTINSAVTTINQSGGVLTTQGSGAITTANIGGEARLNSTGTITTLNVSDGGVAIFANDPRPRTVTNCNLYGGATLNTANGNPLSITFTNGIDLVRCGVDDIELDLGKHLTLTPSAI